MSLHCRVLLDLQCELEVLEKELIQLDQDDAASTARQRQKCLFSAKHDRLMWTRERQQAAFQATPVIRARPDILADIKAKLTGYGQ